MQSTDRQLVGVKFDKEFIEKASAKDRKRPVLEDAMAYVREGDTFVVHSMDRLARNLVDLVQIVEELVKKGVEVEFVKEGLRFDGTPDHFKRLQLQMLGAAAEFERALLRERQREGQLAARLKGKSLGGAPKALVGSDLKAFKADVKAGELTKKAIARKYGISLRSVYNYLSEIA